MLNYIPFTNSILINIIIISDANVLFYFIIS